MRVFQFLHGLITHLFQIPLLTLTDRAKGRHRSWRDASAKRQLLSPVKSQKHRYRIRSDNLELVTILECISASGEVVPPAFCLQNGAAPDLRDELCDDEWSRFGLGLLSCVC